MGCQGSKDERTKEIEDQLNQDKRKAKYEVKMLLLGSGESGKTTILKQMKVIHDGGFSEKEKEDFREIVFANIKVCMGNILKAMDRLDIPLGANLEGEKDRILDEDAPVDFQAVETLWKDRGIQMAFQRANEYQLPDCAKPFFDDVARIGSPGYVPTDQDILFCRIKSTGITETKFKVGDLSYVMVDVGGQRSERRKWIHCFENVTAIIFVVAISTYDQVLIEDESINRMHEALTLFESVCNGKWFAKTSIILFFNKIDLLRDKLKRSQLSEYFPDFEGPNEFEEVIEFFTLKFKEILQSDTKQIYFHQTCATDTDQIRFVMDAVDDIVIKKNLRNIGLL